ncbi:MAG: hypothetical protein R2690_11860 [Acidimicrobiales bacterium]
MAIFDDPLHETFAEWHLGFAPYGGGDVGELQALAAQIGPGDDAAFHEVFTRHADHLAAEAADAEAAGHRASARATYLRAAAYYGSAGRVLFGTPVDARLVDGFGRQSDAFARHLALLDTPAEPLAIPYESTHLPGWLVRNPRRPDAELPTVVVGGGWDSTCVDNYLGIGVATLERDYHIVLVDGPGQGKLLIEEGLPLRHDWEAVITPVVDHIVGIDGVDADRLVYQPWSLGGYMVVRVGAFEHRFAALVADPGQLSVGGKLVAGFRMMGLTPEQETHLPELDPDFADGAMQIIQSDRNLDWSLHKRAFWTNGASTLQELVTELSRWTLTPELLAQVTTPILVASAENDRASTDTDALFAGLPGPKTRMHFTAAEGADMHCEMLNRSLANRRFLDWIDDQVGA